MLSFPRWKRGLFILIRKNRISVLFVENLQIFSWVFRFSFIEGWQVCSGKELTYLFHCRFCWSCLEEIFEKEPTNPKCPDDNEPLERHLTFRDRFAQREILALKCYCPKKSLGCQWFGKLAQLQAHEAECSLSKVKCLYSHLGCDVDVLRYQLAEHVDECLYKVVECPYCQGGLPGVKMREHLEVCQKFPVGCPFGCDKSDIPRECQQEHSKLCPQAPAQCSFNFIGCGFRGTRESLEEHLRTRIAEHLTLSCRFNVNVLQQMENLEQKLQQVITNSEESKSTTDEVKQHLNIQDERLTVLADEVTRLGATAGELRAVLADQGARLSGITEEPLRHTHNSESMPSLAGSNPRLNSVEHSLALHEIQLADQDFKLQMVETTSYDGTFLWKIDNFQRRFRESVEGKTISIYSPPFYTARYGYKLCARAYLNGDGPMGKGKYISLFVVLMRGEYDGLLSWPFQQKITMKLLDQERVSHVTETFRPDPNSSSFQQPRSEMNIALGCPMFCSHNLLRSRGYVRDDTMFIKIIVDGTNMPLEFRKESLGKKIRENEEM